MKTTKLDDAQTTMIAGEVHLSKKLREAHSPHMLVCYPLIIVCAHSICLPNLSTLF